jgi:ubiquinone/menaquinone biosynthesis C-methylase UbiE
MKSFDPACLPILRRIEERHFWFRARNDIITQLLDRWFPAMSRPTPIRLLDVGCGNGNVLRAIGERMGDDVLLVGLDPFRESLRNAKARIDAVWIQGDAVSLPFGETFDAVGLFDVIEHLEDDRHVLESAYRVLRPGGLVLVTVPANERLWSYFDILARHQRRYSKKQLGERLTEAGFTIEFLSYYMAAMFPVVLLWRWMGRMVNSQAVQSGTVDLRVYPVANELMYFALCAERHLLMRRGLPFGTSLVAVARRQNR